MSNRKGDKLSEEQLQKAESLLKASVSRPEDNIRQDIGRLLDALEIDNVITYRTAGGPADIYLPRRRTFFETKTVGLADDPHKPQARENNESPFSQLERYLLSELHVELDQLGLEERDNCDWHGILTDGRVWHVWRFDNKSGAVAQEVISDFRPINADQLLHHLMPILNTKPVGKPWIPPDPRSIFEPAHEQLQDLYESLRGERLEQTQTKSDLWLELLRTGSMEPENVVARRRLFVTHTFLVALARGVIHTVSNPHQKPDASVILKDGFVSWVLDSNKGRDWAQHLVMSVHSFEWRRRRGDVLRPLYEQFVDARDRKTFGEYYTPDWLAELLVEQVLDETWCETAIRAALKAERNQEELEGVGVLDPCCGSGTFLYHAALRLLRSPVLKDVSNSRRAAAIARLVIGIDVHPVAAEISRATLLRALPSEPPDGESAIRVYVGDSLLVSTFDEDSLFRRLNGEVRITTPGGRYVSIPQSFVEQPDFTDNLRRLIASAASNQALFQDILDSVPAEDRITLSECHESFKTIIENEGNSVWAWYIANTAGPLRLREQKVDRIVSNPPWVSMTDIQVPSRKRVLEEFADDRMNLWTGGRNAPHFDISQLFIKRTRDLYLSSPESDPAAWLVKKSALISGGWSKFREWHSPILAQTLDLEAIKPFGGGDARRCCVLFDFRYSNLADSDRIYARIADGKLAPEITLQEANEHVSFHPSPDPLPKEISDYVDAKDQPLFRQGATITPKVLTIVDKAVPTGRQGEFEITTERSAKGDWQQVNPQVGNLKENWIHDLLTSSQLLVFECALTLPQAIIPMTSAGSLVEDPVHESDFWSSLDEIYQELKGKGRRTPKTLREQIDFSSKLSSQLSKASSRKTLVLYPTSGDIMRASRWRPGAAILQHTVHYYQCQTSDEAAYLVALLNAPCLGRAFLESRTSGRHFTNNPWRNVPIAKYEKTNATHRRLASLCKRAERVTHTWLVSQEQNLGQVAASNRIRELLANALILDEIDQEARLLLPNHTD